MYFSFIYDVFAEAAGTDFCDCDTVWSQVFRISNLPQNLQLLPHFRLILIMYFLTWECPVRKPLRIGSLLLLSSTIGFALCLLKFARNTLGCLKPERFYQRDVLICSPCLCVFFCRCSCHRIATVSAEYHSCYYRKAHTSNV